jgi:HSP20 family protein
MANDTRHKERASASANDRVAHRPRSSQPQRRDMPRWDAGEQAYGPFAMMRDMQEQVDRWFTRHGVSDWTSPTSWLSRASEAVGEWSPAFEAFQRGNEYIIRADVPGMTRTDLTVEIGDDAITIHGERKNEAQEDRDGMFFSERSYGSFSRVVPLPPGAISESAKANFSNGVLEVVIQAPSQEVRRGRKVDITGHEKS